VDLIRALARSSAVHGAVAAALLGGWALWANRMHPMPAPLVAGLVQGALSATIAIAQKKIIEAVHARTRTPVPPILAACAFSLAVILVVHTLARTPELLATMSLPWGVGCLYAAIYAATLHRLARTAP